MGLEITSLPHRLYRLTCAFGCVGSMCLCAFDVDFSLVRTWTCIGVVHIDTHPNRTVCTIRQNSSYFYSSIPLTEIGTVPASVQNRTQLVQ